MLRQAVARAAPAVRRKPVAQPAVRKSSRIFVNGLAIRVTRWHRAAGSNQRFCRPTTRLLKAIPQYTCPLTAMCCERAFVFGSVLIIRPVVERSEERRVGKEWRCRLMA